MSVTLPNNKPFSPPLVKNFVDTGRVDVEFPSVENSNALPTGQGNVCGMGVGTFKAHPGDTPLDNPGLKIPAIVPDEQLIV